MCPVENHSEQNRAEHATHNYSQSDPTSILFFALETAMKPINITSVMASINICIPENVAEPPDSIESTWHKRLQR